jgi:DNA-binding transcriptional LysR family regulator
MQLNDIDLNKLATFLAVVEAGGVSKAARQLGRSASAVSQSLTSLEASLGAKLFDRVRKELVLTRGGQLLHTCVAGYRALLAQTVGELSGGAAEVTGTVRLGLFLGFPRVRSRELLIRFAERHPRAAVRVVHAPQHDLESRLRRNRLDFVLSYAPRSATAPDLVSTRLFAQELVLVSSARHFQSGFSTRELAQTPVVDYYQSDPLIMRWLAHHFAGEQAQPNVRFWAATTDLVLELVQNGAGVGVLPRLMLNSDRPGLKSSPVPSGAGRRPVASARRSAAPRGAELREVGPSPPLVDHVWLNEPRDAYRDRTQRAFRDVLLEVLAAPGDHPSPGGGSPPRRQRRKAVTSA